MIAKSKKALPIAAAAAIITASTTHPAFAVVAGSVDPSTGMTSLANWFLGLSLSAIIIICMWKGAHDYGHGRGFGPTIAGFIIGAFLAVGGYYALSHMGISVSSL